MAKLPRITVSISDDDYEILKIVLYELNLNSTGQLLKMLCSGDSTRINWISKAFIDYHK